MSKSKKILISIFTIIIIIAIAILVILNTKLEGSFVFKKGNEIILRSNGVDQYIGIIDSEVNNLQVSNDQKYIAYSNNNRLEVWEVQSKSKKTYDLNTKIYSFAWGKDSNEIIYSSEDGLKQFNLNDSTSKLIYKNSNSDFIDFNTKITPNHNYTAFSLDFSIGESKAGGIIVDLTGNVNKEAKRCGTTQGWSKDDKSLIITQKNAIGGCNGIYIVRIVDGKDIIVNNNIFFPESAKFYNNDKSIFVIEGDVLKTLDIDTNQSKDISNLGNPDNDIVSRSILYVDTENSVFIFEKSNNRSKSKIVKVTNIGSIAIIVDNLY